MATAEPGERRSQAERTAVASSRMIRAAIALISRQGFTKTTLAQVGREAGYTGGLVSHHFGSKEGLLRELVGHITSRFYSDQIAPATGDQTGIAALQAMADTYFDELGLRAERMRALYVLMGESLGPVSEVGDVFAQLNDGFRARCAGIIAAGIAAGEIRSDVDPDAQAAVCVGMLRGVALQWMAEPGCFDLDGVRTSVRETFHAQLARR